MLYLGGDPTHGDATNLTNHNNVQLMATNVQVADSQHDSEIALNESNNASFQTKLPAIPTKQFIKNFEDSTGSIEDGPDTGE